MLFKLSSRSELEPSGEAFVRFAAKDGALDHSRDVSNHQVLPRSYYYSTARFLQMVW